MAWSVVSVIDIILIFLWICGVGYILSYDFMMTWLNIDICHILILKPILILLGYGNSFDTMIQIKQRWIKVWILKWKYYRKFHENKAAFCFFFYHSAFS